MEGLKWEVYVPFPRKKRNRKKNVKVSLRDIERMRFIKETFGWSVYKIHKVGFPRLSYYTVYYYLSDEFREKRKEYDVERRKTVEYKEYRKSYMKDWSKKPVAEEGRKRNVVFVKSYRDANPHLFRKPCPDCGKEIMKHSKRCGSCANKEWWLRKELE